MKIGSDLKMELEVFYNSLTKEKETFDLPLYKILGAKFCIVRRDENGKIMGIAGIQKKYNLMFAVVKKEYQNRGIGRELFRETVRRAIAEGVPYIAGNLYASNARSLHLLLKVGFTPLHVYSQNCRRRIFVILPLNRIGQIAKYILYIRLTIKSAIRH